MMRNEKGDSGRKGRRQAEQMLKIIRREMANAANRIGSSQIFGAARWDLWCVNTHEYD